MFCPKCKSLLLPQVVNGKKVLKCQTCGYMSVGEMKLSSAGSQAKDLEVFNEDDQHDIRLDYDIKCPQCGHSKAKGYERQMRSADEPPSTFLECMKCHHKWRNNK